MQPLVSINTHTHISLLSINVSPGTFLAALALSFVFLFTYLVTTGVFSLRSLARLWNYLFARKRRPIVYQEIEIEEIPPESDIPALPPPEAPEVLWSAHHPESQFPLLLLYYYYYFSFSLLFFLFSSPSASKSQIITHAHRSQHLLRRN
ncbi:hypothetical protein F4780DRAFT_780667 [Xylariomycetidae sp. FL0641]|nr:hypothetical protein F4780DRAFT_780667 [Xylariomycetidae sp. FL0641]